MIGNGYETHLLAWLTYILIPKRKILQFFFLYHILAGLD
uniref:Uncharacterized protein n=1 Tax=Anguilla anguilla TaxID=7936 RepID=A0A0E9VKW9_ANGAN